MILNLTPLFAFLFIGAYVSVLFGALAFGGGFSYFFFAFVSQQVTRCVLLYVFEKRMNMRIMQQWFGPGLVVIPKPPSCNIDIRGTAKGSRGVG
jgi:hypothetical protein